MNYNKISKETFNYLYKSRESLNVSPLDAQIRLLVEMRVSQINQCSYCLRLHTDEALKLGIQQEKIHALQEWETSTLFDDKEKMALKWAESVTRLDNHLSQVRIRIIKIFSEKEVVDLTACISIMNALNRIAISLRD